MQIPQTSLVGLDKHLIVGWRERIFQLWTIRIAVFWAALNGLANVWFAFSGLMPLWLFTSASILFSVAIVIARLHKQPGADA